MDPFGTLAKRLAIAVMLAGGSQILADEGRACGGDLGTNLDAGGNIL
jgi:hypothetical protein